MTITQYSITLCWIPKWQILCTIPAHSRTRGHWRIFRAFVRLVEVWIVCLHKLVLLMLLDTKEPWKRFANHHKSQIPFWCGVWGPMFLPTKISAISDLSKCVNILPCSPYSHHLIHLSFIPKASKPLRMNSKTVLKFSGDGASNRTESQIDKSASPNHSQPWKIVWNIVEWNQCIWRYTQIVIQVVALLLEFSNSCWTSKRYLPQALWKVASEYNNCWREHKYSHSHEKTLERAHNKTNEYDI